MADDDSDDQLLHADHVVEYPYRRSVGPVLGAFFTGLRDAKITGVRAADGRVIVPPAEYDPDTGAATGEIVEVADRGVVTSWCWVADPLEHHLLDRPFAFALVKLDGADTALLHLVDAYRIEHMATGMRVAATWRSERVGNISDIVCFAPEVAS